GHVQGGVVVDVLLLIHADEASGGESLAGLGSIPLHSDGVSSLIQRFTSGVLGSNGHSNFVGGFGSIHTKVRQGSPGVFQIVPASHDGSACAGLDQNLILIQLQLGGIGDGQSAILGGV